MHTLFSTFKFKGLHFLFFTGFILINNVWAQSYYHDTAEDIILKKSIIKALIEQRSPDYLKSIELPLWNTEDFYESISPFETLDFILEESSNFEGMSNPLTFDGDRIAASTGRHISDIPGSAVVVYDGKTEKSLQDYRSLEILDGDGLWIENGKSFSEIPSGKLIVYDCLFPPTFICGKKTSVRPTPFPREIINQSVQSKNNPSLTIDIAPMILWKKFLLLPWYIKLFWGLLIGFIAHLIVMSLVMAGKK